MAVSPQRLVSQGLRLNSSLFSGRRGVVSSALSTVCRLKCGVGAEGRNVSAVREAMKAWPKSTIFAGHDVLQASARWLHTSRPALGVVSFKLADIGEGIAEVELLRWYKQVGETVEEMEAVCEVQSDKAAVEITSRYSGPVVKLHHEKGDMIKIGAPLMDIEVQDEEGESSTPEKTHPASPAKPTTVSSTSTTAKTGGTVAAKEAKASPATRRLAKELGVELSLVTGTGKGGVVTKEDVENSAASAPTTSSPPGGSRFPPPSSPVSMPKITIPHRLPKENTEVPIRGFGRAMVKSMTEALSIPHLNIGDEYDVTDLVALRQELRSMCEKKYGVKLTLTPLIIKAVSLCLNKHPILNSKIDPSGEKYTIFGSHNISMAIDSPNGLVVPNIKNVQDLNVVEIQAELLRLQTLAQSNKFSASDLTGGTVSISNVGVISGTYVKPLLFDNQAMIIGIGRTMTLPRYDKKMQVGPRDIINIAFSADHRHCDGATVARYAAELKSILECPGRMLLEMQ